MSLSAADKSRESSEFTDEDKRNLEIYVHGLLRQELTGAEGRYLKAKRIGQVIEIANKLPNDQKHLILGKVFLKGLKDWVTTEKTALKARKTRGELKKRLREEDLQEMSPLG